MTTTFLLVRHAAHDNVGGFLAGRLPGITLGIEGKAQAQRLGERLRGQALAAIVSSPRERTQETATALASGRDGVAVQTAAELDEVDFGSWSGGTWDTLNQDPRWQRWNAMRSLARTPGGESMLDVQVRVTGLMERLAARYPDQSIALVSHADIIKIAVAHVLGLPIDAWPRFEISPASVTTVVLGEWGGKVLTLNDVTP